MEGRAANRRAGRKPRILFVANRILGWNTYSTQLVQRLEARDDVDLEVLWRRPHRLSTAFQKRPDATGSERLYRRINPVAAYRGVLGMAIRRAVRDARPDVVHFAAHWPAASVAWVAGGPPFTVSPDSTMPDMERALENGIWTAKDTAREGALFRGATHVFPMSNWTARSLREDYGVPAHRISVMPPSLELSAFCAPTGGRDVPNVIFIGNDIRRKGGDRLADWVRGPLAGKCHLHIVSTDEGGRIEGPGITWHGRVDHGRLLRELLPSMDILCLPTRLDMSPHVLIEAAAAGIPAVASDLGGVPDIVLHRRTGLLVGEGDDAGFVAALGELIGSPALREEMGRAARAHAEATFDAARNFDALCDRLVEIAATGGKQVADATDG